MEMNGMLNELIITIVMGLFSLALAGVTYCFTMLASKIKAQTLNIKNEEIRNVATNSLKQLDELVYKTVSSVEVEVGAEIRQAVSDGRVSKDELLALKDVAKNDVLLGLKPEFIDACGSIVGDVDKYVQNEIERVLGVIKGKILDK